MTLLALAACVDPKPSARPDFQAQLDSISTALASKYRRLDSLSQLAKSSQPDSWTEFLTDFFRDSSFQRVHIRFPLSFRYLNKTRDGQDSATIVSNKWRFFQHDLSDTNYVTRTLDLSGHDNNSSQRVFSISLPRSDAFDVSFHFERHNGSWILVVYEDASL
jgi:hypothetical protein